MDCLFSQINKLKRVQNLYCSHTKKRQQTIKNHLGEVAYFFKHPSKFLSEILGKFVFARQF